MIQSRSSSLHRPHFLLPHPHFPSQLPLFSSNSFPIHRSTFQSRISRAVTLSSESSKSTSITSRQILRSSSSFENCKFHALLAVHGESEETSGAAVFSENFDVSFKSCSFSGNSAVAGGCCSLVRATFSFELCNFTSNRATFEAGVISVDSGKLVISDSNFVLNEAELYIGVIKAVNATIEGDGLIFHANRAVFHSAVLDAEGTNIEITVSQFSANKVDSEDGGVVHHLKGSGLKLVGCNFETTVRENGTRKRPIRADMESRVVIKQCCFDTPELVLKGSIEGSYSASIGTIFAEKCQCSHVTLPLAFDLVEKSIRLEDSLLTSGFMISTIGLVLTTLLVLFLLIWDARLLKWL